MNRRHSRLTRIVALAISVHFLFQATAEAAQRSAQGPTPARSVEIKESEALEAVITLLNGHMSEALILRTIQASDQAYTLTPAAVVRLQQAGASERIIEAMMASASGAAASPERAVAAAPPAPATTAPLASATKADEKSRRSSFFGRAAGRLKATAGRSAERAVTSVETSADKAVDDAAAAVDDGVDKQLGSVEEKVESGTGKATGKVSDRRRTRQ